MICKQSANRQYNHTVHKEVIRFFFNYLAERTKGLTGWRSRGRRHRSGVREFTTISLIRRWLSLSRLGRNGRS